MCELLHTCPTKKQRRGRAATKDDYAAETGRSDVHVGAVHLPVCIENLIRFHCVAESHNVSANGHTSSNIFGVSTPVLVL
jgi:hypothetical protein